VAKKKASEPATPSPPPDAGLLLDAVVKEFLPKFGGGARGKKIESLPTPRKILALDPAAQADVLKVALDRLEELEGRLIAFRAGLKGFEATAPQRQPGWAAIWDPRWALAEMVGALLRHDLPLTEPVLVRLVRWPRDDAAFLNTASYPLAGIVAAAERFGAASEIGPLLRTALEIFFQRLYRQTYDKECRKIASRVQAVLAGGPAVDLEAGEAWSDAALADLGKMAARPRWAWNALLQHCQVGGAGKLTERWREQARPLLDAVGFDEFKEHVLRWFPLVDRPRTEPAQRQHPLEPDAFLLLRNQLLKDAHVELLRGVVWCCGLREDADLARAVARLALSAYRKIPGKGPRLVALGNACITALGMMPGRPPIGQLALLKVKIKFGTAQKEIDKAFTASAAREGLPRDEIEELSVPSYGLEEVGRLRTTLGEYQAELLVDGGTAALHWSKEGKPLKSVPAAVKKEHGEQVKELQATVKDVSAMLPAQRERLDTLIPLTNTHPDRYDR
jgi:hypothetical protein